ncbi:MAG: AAA domain-containing protein [Stenotrophomonas maltophilia]
MSKYLATPSRTGAVDCQYNDLHQEMGLNNQERIVRYWHAVELLQPQAAPELGVRERDSLPFLYDTDVDAPTAPWMPDSPLASEKIGRKLVWSHTLYAHLYSSNDVAERLKALFGADQGYREPAKQRESALFAIKFTAAGEMVQDSFVLSSEAWFLGRVLAEKDWTRGFESDQDLLREQIKTLMTVPVSADALRAVTRMVRNFIGLSGFFGDTRRKSRFRCAPVKIDKPDVEDDPLNSFFLSELADVADSLGKGEAAAALHQYLDQHNPDERMHVDDEDACWLIMKQLAPAEHASGCWPSEGHRGLVHSQQLAVNAILSTLSEGQGLLGVNGPPGTGKTTLLRDLIAAVVTRRADALCGLARASDAFVKNGMEKVLDSGKSRTCFALNPVLYGHEIVIASSNNGAVENVTLELPQKDKIDESWLPDAGHFADLGSLVSGAPSWGLISAALGSKKRRGTFVERYFDGKQPYGAESGKRLPDVATAPQSVVGAKLPVEALEDPGAEVVAALAADQAGATKGLKAWLDAQADISRTPEQRKARWQEAVLAYRSAKLKVDRLATQAATIHDRIGTLIDVRHMVSGKIQMIEDLRCRRMGTAEDLETLDADQLGPAQQAMTACLMESTHHKEAKPGWWANLLSFGNARRQWRDAGRSIAARCDLASSAVDRLTRAARRLNDALASLADEQRSAERALIVLQEKVTAIEDEVTDAAQRCNAFHILEWLRTGRIEGDAVQLAEPWKMDGWRVARAQVFIQALALHRVFFELEAKRVRSNLSFINSVLTGGRFTGVSREAVRSAWATLFMAVPVLSSTFASFVRSFGSFGVGEIGWLLVDEAGQAPPQAAVGALWRARRAVLVGDPLQLKPIVNVSDAVLEHMRAGYRVDDHWLPNRRSAQGLADAATRWGKMMGSSENRQWVGLPLIVHRRCDRPMFDLANRIAYGEAMVYGTISPSAEKETKAFLQTGWIHAAGPSSGNWVPVEGEVLQALIAELQRDGVDSSEIAVVTPFKAVRRQLGTLLPADVVQGTIHTMQGKEAAVVILVLGGDSSKPGARSWAVSEPNLLNVAATRAKRRFFVIGDLDDWRSRNLFCEVMDLLPERALRVESGAAIL